jgi:hypothetical protein
MSHHKTAGTIGATSGCMVTVKHALSSWGEGDTDKTCPLGGREMQTKPCLSPWGTETRQRHRGHCVLSIHEMKLNMLKVCRPRGHRRTIGTVTVICGNNIKGFTCRAPRGQSGNLQQHEAANKCSKQFLSFIYMIGTKMRMNLSTVCQLKGSQHSCHDQPGKLRQRHI